MNIEIKKDILIPAAENPENHEFYWAINLSYRSNDGLGMIMTALRRISTGNDNWRQRRSTIQRRISEDNGASWTPHGPEISSGSYESKNLKLPWLHFLDPDNNLMLSLYQTSRPHPKDDGWATPLYYETSSDAGKTLGPRHSDYPPRQRVQ